MMPLRKLELNLFHIILALSFIFQSFLIKTAFAQNCNQTVPIFKGEISKCDGLVYPEFLIKEHLLLRTNAEELSQELKVTKESYNNKMKAYKDYMIQTEKEIIKLKNPPFYKSFTFGFFSGVMFSIVSFITISTTLN